MITQEQKESKRKSQEEKAIEFMKEHGHATVRELCIYCNINSPTKVISTLNRRGLIRKGEIKKPGKMPYKVYYLRDPE